MPEHIQSLLSDLKNGLSNIYGRRLKGVFLFGSYARGEQDHESDVDILIVLTHYHQYRAEIQRTSELVSTLSLEYGSSISRVFLEEESYLKDDTPLLRNVRQEAIAV